MLLGIDLGTGSVKALLLSSEGSVIAQASAPYEVRSPRPGYAETLPSAWWAATLRVVREACAGYAAEVAAVGLSGQMHGVVLLSGAGTPLRPAVLWADTRAAPVLDRYRERAGDDLAKLKNPVTAGMAGPTLFYLRETKPEALGGVRWALQPKDGLRYRLTGEVASEASDASGTLLFDVAGGGWLDGLMVRLGLEPAWLPPLTTSGAVAGALTREAAEGLGLRAGTPVVAGGADTACAAFGSGLTRAGAAQLTVGTGAQIILVQTEPDDASARGVHLYRTIDYRTTETQTIETQGAPFYALAAVQNAGLALEWARRSLNLSWAELYREAFSVPSSSGVTFLPYLTGERTPHLDAQVRGVWAGLALHHTPAELARSAFEGVAFALRDGLDALLAGAAPLEQLFLAGGGTLEPAWQQLLADALESPLYLSDASSASAVGAARLAGLGTGVTFALPEPTFTGVVTPKNDLSAPYARFRALYPQVKGWG